jgi:phytanoyl-CoA hydroxylase
MGTLTPTQVQHFHEQGFLLVEDALDQAADLQPVLDEYAVVLDEIAERLFLEGALISLHAKLPFAERLIQVCAESGQNFPQHFDFSLPQTGVTCDTPIHVGPAVFRLLRNPRLLDVVESIVGSEILSNPVQHIRMKLPRRAVAAGSTNGLVTKIPWHQDNGVVMPEADEGHILTVWLPLNEATVENGCLQVIPGSHRQGIEPHCPTPSGLSIPNRFLDQERALPVPMRPGSLLLMTQRTMHSSLDNVTDDQVRISMDLRYQPLGEPTGRPAFASAGFVARSRAHPELELHDPEVWAANWLATRERLAAATDTPTFNRWRADAPVCA